MTNEELKEAFFKEVPVILKDRVNCIEIMFNKITAIIYRKSKQTNELIVSAELLDRRGNSVVIVKADDVFPVVL